MSAGSEAGSFISTTAWVPDVPQFATFIERIHPFDATQRPRRGRPPRKH